MKDVLQVLRDARDLISDRSRWVTGISASTEDGGWADPYDKSRAVRWCASGAIYVCSDLPREARNDNDYITEHNEAWRRLAVELPFSAGAGESAFSAIPAVNDNPTMGHSVIMRGFDRAIARLEKERELLFAELNSEETVDENELVLS